jgi:hypothetical protein
MMLEPQADSGRRRNRLRQIAFGGGTRGHGFTSLSA